MILICKQHCKRCEEIKKLYTSTKYIELPDISIGLGDTISNITSFFGIYPCPACRLRQNWCNKWFPYFWRFKLVPFNTREIKRRIYKLGVRQFPVLVDDSMTEIIQCFK